MHGCTHRYTGRCSIPKHMMGGASAWVDTTGPISLSQHFYRSHMTMKMEVASSSTSTSQSLPHDDDTPKQDKP